MVTSYDCFQKMSQRMQKTSQVIPKKESSSEDSSDESSSDSGSSSRSRSRFRPLSTCSAVSIERPPMSPISNQGDDEQSSLIKRRRINVDEQVSPVILMGSQPMLSDNDQGEVDEDKLLTPGLNKSNKATQTSPTKNTAFQDLVLNHLAEQKVFNQELKSELDAIHKRVFPELYAFPIQLPIESLVDVRKLEKMCQKEPGRVLPILRRFKPKADSASTNSGLSQIFSDGILNLYNFEGVKGKESFAKLRINELLKTAWDDVLPSETNKEKAFKTLMQHQFRMAKNRTRTYKSRKKKNAAGRGAR